MPAQVLSTVENNFTKGLVTEFTGLNFPENAATDTDNCIYTLVGDVTRREGFDFEDNFVLNSIVPSGSINTYKWNNVGGDGLTQIVVAQVGYFLRFWQVSNATILSPLSTTLLGSQIDIRTFLAQGSSLDPSQLECQFSDGNGYLFVYHPNCDPFYCTYTAGIVVANLIQVQIRDFNGIYEPGVSVNSRPVTVTQEHLYNITNQGWTQGSPWQAYSNTIVLPALGNFVFNVVSGLSVNLGDYVSIYMNHGVQPGGGLPYVPAGTILISGTVTAYSGNSLSIAASSANPSPLNNQVWGDWGITPINHGYINTWVSTEGTYPSNADVWWYFKDNTDAFNPTITAFNVTLNTGPAPQGHYVLNAFNQTRSLISGISGLTDVVTSVRPKTGTWFQGRVWYTGVDAQQPATGDAAYYTWTESVYFSQIVTTVADFGSCYQSNDPTSENLFDLLPTDGGVINIQGSGSIYKLFPIQNGMLVFAANGIWFITGSQGIGFSANDYTITKISSVQSISSTSFVDVQGLPYFWNEEGIYAVSPAQQGGLSVEPLTVGTILSFYNEIPLSSKKYVRGSYHPIDYIIQWTYNPNQETSIADRYRLNQVLNFNTYNKAFYPYTISTSTPNIIGIEYVAGPGGSNSPDPVFKYFTSTGTAVTFSEESNDSYIDWFSYDNTGVNFDSYFVSGYRLHGQGQRRFQIPYIYIFSNSAVPTSYKIQGVWDYANTGNSGRWSTAQLINNWSPNFDVIFRRHKIRGRGLVLQLKVTSADGQPFDIIGWSTLETTNTGV